MIELENVAKSYGEVAAVGGITLELSPTEVLGLIGPSGCGKTTLLRLVAGLEIPDQGKVIIEDVEMSNPSRVSPPHKRGLSMIFQDLALWPHMTAMEHIDFVQKKDRLSRDESESRARAILSDVNLDGHGGRYPHELSGGEQQRLAIARALASKPAYLLMDEPFSNLDCILKEELQPLLLGLKNRREMGILYVTHNTDEVLSLADRIAIMNKGKIEQIDNKEAILNHPKNDFVRRFLGVK